MIDLGALVAKIKIDSEKATKDLKEFNEKIKNAKEELEKTEEATEKSTKSFVKFESILKKINIGAIAAIGAIGTSAVKVTADFDYAMDKVSAISGATSKDLESLRDKAKEMGATTKYSARESAEAFNYMAMAGMQTKDMLETIDDVMALASSTGTDLAITSDIVTDAMTGFKVKAEDVGHFVDVLAKTSSSANTNVEIMGETFKYVAPTASAMGFSIEDTAVAIGLLANSGIKGSQAGTTLRQTFSRLVNPTKEAKEALDALGIEVVNSDGTIKSLSEIITVLSSKFSNLEDVEKTQYASMIAGQEAMSGFLAIANAAPSDIEKLTTAIANADGSAKAMSRTMEDNLKGKFTTLKSQLEGLSISIGEKIMPSIESLVEGVSKFINFIVEHKDATVTTLSAIGAGLIALNVTTMIQKMIATFKVLQIALQGTTIKQLALNVAMNTNPIGLIIAGVTALGVALFGLIKHFSKASEEMQKYNKETEGLIDNIEKINNNIEENTKAYEDNLKNIKAQTSANKMLAKEIEILVQMEELDSGQKLLLKNKIDELNSSVEGLNLAYDEETKTLNKNAQAIDEQISKGEMQVKLNADLEEQNRIRQDLAQATTMQEEATVRLADVSLKLSETEQLSYNDKKVLKEQQEELTKSIENSQGVIDSLNTKYEEINKVVEENAIKIEEANNIKAESEELYQDAINNTANVLDNMVGLTEEAKEQAKKILDDLTAQTTNAFNKINQDASVSINELIDNIKSNTQTIEKWTKDIEILMERGVNEAFIETLKEAGPEMAKTVEGLVNASDEKIAELNSVFENGSKTAIDGMKRLMGLPETTKTGSDMIDNVAKGVEENKNLDKASEKSIENAHRTMDKAVDNSNFAVIGKEIVTGVASGINGNKKIINSAVKNVTDDIQTSFKKELDIHSPSRVMIGLSKFVNEGIAKGLIDSKGLPTKAMEDICSVIIASGNNLSTGLIETDKLTGEKIYSNTFKVIYDKIELFEKEKDKRLQTLEKMENKNEKYYSREMGLYQKMHDAKMKLLEQEYLAKVSLIDDESAEQIKALQNQIEDINKQKEKEQRAEEEKRYLKEVEEKKKQLANSLYDSEEYHRIKAELQEIENKRAKELLNQKREEEKENLRAEIEAIREQASKKKDELKDELEHTKFIAEQKLKNELDILKQMQENLKEDLEERKKIEDEKSIKSTETNKKITDNEKIENKNRKNDFKNLIKENEIEFIKFKSTIKKLSYEVGRNLADGIKSTS